MNIVLENSKSITYEEAKANVIHSFGQDDEDDDIVATCTMLSVRCPLGLVVIQLPARGLQCQHLQCFDLRTFLMNNRVARSRAWECIVCYKKLSISDLRIDPFLKELLAQISNDEDLEEVEIFPDASWKKRRLEKSNQHASPETKKVKIEDVHSLHTQDPMQPWVDLGSSVPTSARGTPSVLLPSHSSTTARDHAAIDLTLSSDDEDKDNDADVVDVTTRTGPVPLSTVSVASVLGPAPPSCAGPHPSVPAPDILNVASSFLSFTAPHDGLDMAHLWSSNDHDSSPAMMARGCPETPHEEQHAFNTPPQNDAQEPLHQTDFITPASYRNPTPMTNELENEVPRFNLDHASDAAAAAAASEVENHAKHLNETTVNEDTKATTSPLNLAQLFGDEDNENDTPDEEEDGKHHRDHHRNHQDPIIDRVHEMGDDNDEDDSDDDSSIELPSLDTCIHQLWHPPCPADLPTTEDEEDLEEEKNVGLAQPQNHPKPTVTTASSSSSLSSSLSSAVTSASTTASLSPSLLLTLPEPKTPRKRLIRGDEAHPRNHTLIILSNTNNKNSHPPSDHHCDPTNHRSSLVKEPDIIYLTDSDE